MNAEFQDVWQGRIDSEDGEAGLRCHQIIKPITDNKASPGTALVGFASDLGVQHNQGRIGACEGPLALRKAMANLAWHHASPLYDAGDIHIDMQKGNDPLATAQTAYANKAASLLGNQHRVIGLGGGHEIAWASYQGYRQHLDQHGQRQANIGIINFDAHFDLRQPPTTAEWAGSSGTPFYQVAADCQQRQQKFSYACLGISESANTQALFKTAKELEVQYLLDYQCEIDAAKILIDEFVAGLDYLYLTICLDALPAAIAPGVSAPAAFGINLEFVFKTLQHTQAACKKHAVKWLMSDIAELNPKYDIDQRTEKLAARLAYELMK